MHVIAYSLFLLDRAHSLVCRVLYVPDRVYTYVRTYLDRQETEMLKLISHLAIFFQMGHQNKSAQFIVFVSLLDKTVEQTACTSV